MTRILKRGIYFINVFITVLSTITACTNPAVIEERGEGSSLESEIEFNEIIEIRYDSTKLSKTSKMLDENLYWKIISRSIKASTSLDDQEKWLISELSKLSTEKIIGFKLRTHQLLIDSYNSDLWCAGYIMNGGCSDDCFEYFRCWIISRGRDIYYNSKANPDYLINEANTGDLISEIKIYEFEGLLNVAVIAFNQKTGKEIYDYLDYAGLNAYDADDQLKLNWNEGSQESMKKICPKLYEKFQ
ncbi:MAG: DUF4240 domain-containing protein [Sporocytophaga sp.]|uniref:DUF4240 domain-containing protein n=1 Tax=Sporocytophaga sp. TaxID=2231183 RepID=UPI001B0DDA14|nr:DUF4240 domain-containing protein [Sporocytophaga sp.]MBO9699827.1 DUF4240 domain-containing protein [Sporocytophaga sp.]